MPSNIEYARLSVRVYTRTRENNTPLLEGWSPVGVEIPDRVSGFSAGVYKKGNEIAIAYTGTNEPELPGYANGNVPAAKVQG